MPIDILSYSPLLSGLNKRVISQNLPLRGTRYLIEDLSNALSSVGWSLIDSYYASGAFSFPLIMPHTDPTPLPPGGSTSPRYPSINGIVQLSGVKFDYYDPVHEFPVITPGYVWFSTGLTDSATGASLAAAISSSTSYHAVSALVSSHIVITYTAYAPGPAFNMPQTFADSHWAIAIGADGGGWLYEASIAASKYQVKMTAEHFGFMGLYHPGVNDGWVRLQFFFDTHLGTADLYVAPYPQDFQPLPVFTILANPHGFCIVDPLSPSSRSNVSMLVTAPSRDTGAAYCVIVVGDRTITPQTTWASASLLKVALDADAVSYSNVRILALHTPGTTPLKTMGGGASITGAFAFLGTPTQYYVGRLYDCIMVNDLVSDGMFNGANYTKIGNQTGSGGKTRSTLLWKS